MKKMLLILGITVGALSIVGCDEDPILIEPDNPPTTPQGVFSVTGDQVVWVIFNGIFETDVREYAIFRSLDPVINFVEVGTIAADDNPNLDLIVYTFPDTSVTNGTTYFYAVAAIDFADQMSDLSAENVFDTPRPEGVVLLLSNDIANGNSAGFSLSAGTPVDDGDIAADLYVDRFQGIMYINVGNLNTFIGDIQDMGYTDDLDGIDFAPDTGWSDLGFYELIEGHTYVIRTQESNFAKMRVTILDASSGIVQFDWAYQTDTNNRELAPALNGDQGVPRRSKDELLSGITTQR